MTGSKTEVGCLVWVTGCKTLRWWWLVWVDRLGDWL